MEGGDDETKNGKIMQNKHLLLPGKWLHFLQFQKESNSHVLVLLGCQDDQKEFDLLQPWELDHRSGHVEPNLIR